MNVKLLSLRLLAVHSSYFNRLKEAKRIPLGSFCLFCLMFLASTFPAIAQTKDDSLLVKKSIIKLDSLTNNKKKSLAKLAPLVPDVVAKHSAMIPGWGHIELKQYWAPPLIYGGFAFAGYNIVVNNNGYQKYVAAYLEASSTKKDQVVDGRTFNVDRLRLIKDGYRRNRDLSAFSVAGIWAVQVVLANVTAHLRTFDISEDISMEVSPSFMSDQTSGNVHGLKLTVHF